MLRTKSAGSTVCKVKLDRTEHSSTFSTKPPQFPGFTPDKNKPDILLRRTTTKPSYRRVNRQINLSTGTQLSVRYQPTGTLLAPLKITAIPRDETGMSPRELLGLIQACGGKHRLTLVECAFDFVAEKGIDNEFVRRHSYFGKSRPEQNPKHKEILRHGGLNSSRNVRSYLKESIGVYRVEIVIHSRRLRESGCSDRTICRLKALDVFPSDFCFVSMDWSALEKSLRRSGRKCEEIVHEAKQCSSSLHAVFRCLRKHRIRNTDRFVVPMEINREVAKAWAKWLKEFSFTSKLTKKVEL